MSGLPVPLPPPGSVTLATRDAACVEITAGDVGLARATGIITPVGAEPVEISGPMLDEIERLLLSGAA